MGSSMRYVLCDRMFASFGEKFRNWNFQLVRARGRDIVYLRGIPRLRHRPRSSNYEDHAKEERRKSMNLLTPSLSEGTKLVYSALYDSQEPGFLAQDLLLAELASGLYIDVSWFPEHDPSGEYTVSVFRAHEQLYNVEVKSPHEALRLSRGCRAYSPNRSRVLEAERPNLEIPNRTLRCALWAPNFSRA